MTTERKVIAAMLLALLAGLIGAIQIGTEIYCQAIEWQDGQREKRRSLARSTTHRAGIGIEALPSGTNWIIKGNVIINVSGPWF